MWWIYLNLFYISKWYASFGVTNSKLTYRIRAKAFKCFLCQEVAYFDRPENDSSSICTRLSSGALAVQKVTGSKLAGICETISMTILALIFGGYFNWQIMLIIFAFLLLEFCLAYVDIIVQLRLPKLFAQLSVRVSSVGLNYSLSISMC